ncbi:MAG: CRISPR-associated protein Cas4 [Acidobacteriaceae bacterium]|nr:CRISPR-associated protein Cas4 [Acidobacteriaceae bacterium]
MFTEENLLPLSGLQHLLFCERQWALIHIEQQWEENRLTEEGRVLHDRAHEAATETRPDVVTARGLRVRSLRLGLAGQMDVCEFRRTTPEDTGAIKIPGRDGHWYPFPVEYKRGRPKKEAWDEVQLCAQALCLEEMFGARITFGALFYGEKRRRTPVAFDPALRAQTEWLAEQMHRLFESRATPPPVYEPKCANCSLSARCMPALPRKPAAVARYVSNALRSGEVA